MDNKYKENPKSKGSGIICCIPQDTKCDIGCPECFFTNGRSYLEPLEENLPNMPIPSQTENRVVRVNDGNDSSTQKEAVMEATKFYGHKFYNTSVPYGLSSYDAPVVLTANPGRMTDKNLHLVTPVENLMFVRILTNTWNRLLVDEGIDYYTTLGVPTVLTFMAYHSKASIPTAFDKDYIHRKRTLNDYWAITYDAYERVMEPYRKNMLVFSCGVEGVSTRCMYCGNCLREYYNTIVRMGK